jgi:hypothetical protein
MWSNVSNIAWNTKTSRFKTHITLVLFMSVIPHQEMGGRNVGHMEMEGTDMGGSDQNYRRCATATCIPTATVKSIYMDGWHCEN